MTDSINLRTNSAGEFKPTIEEMETPTPKKKDIIPVTIAPMIATMTTIIIIRELAISSLNA